MSQPAVTKEDFDIAVARACEKDTSSDPDGWTPENPHHGHDTLIVRATAAMFGEGGLDGSRADRAESERYALFSFRLMRGLHPGNLLFLDRHFWLCYEAALASPSRGIRHGAMLWIDHNDDRRSREVCVGHGGDENPKDPCGHAEEAALWRAVHEHGDLPRCTMYIASVQRNGMPHFVPSLDREDLYECNRCAVQMHNARLRSVAIPFGGTWHFISTQEVATAAALHQILGNFERNLDEIARRAHEQRALVKKVLEPTHQYLNEKKK